MARKLSDIESEAMQLPQQERALLVERLLTTFDVGQDVDAAEQVFEDAQKKLQ